MLAIGTFLSYYLSPKTKYPIQKQVNTKKVLSPISSIFILVGFLGILTFCLGIDGGNYTPEKEDDMNILNGIAIGICALSLEKNTVFLIRKLKFCRNKYK